MKSFAASLMFALFALGSCGSTTVSPVQKIIAMLGECKAKTQSDLEVESKQMEKYTQFCDDEATAKTHDIDTAARQLDDLDADIEDATATIAARTEEITELGSDIASLNGELHKAKEERESRHQTFLNADKALVSSIDQLGQAIVMTDRAMKSIEEGAAVSFLQTSHKIHAPELSSAQRANLKSMMKAISSVIDAEGVDVGSKQKLQSFLETPKKDGEGDDDDELALAQQMMKPWRGDSTAGSEAQDALKKAGLGGPPKPPSLGDTLERMRGQAEGRLADVRKKEMEGKHSFELVQQGLDKEASHATQKMATATEDKAGTTQRLENSKSRRGETAAAKAADEKLKATLQMDCQAKAREWEERTRSASGEIAAINKATEVLVKGVKVFVQVGIQTRHTQDGDSEESTDEGQIRKKLADTLRALAQQRHSFALSQLAGAATSDPLGKVRGLIEGMIEKVMQQAHEAATKEAFCQEEMGKGKKKQEEKSADVDKHKTRMDSASTTIAELSSAIQSLTSELAEIDSSQAEAVQMRSEEKTEYKKSSSDFKQSAEAIAQATDVLKSYYEGAVLLQVQQPSFGGNQGDAASGILAILELVQQDVTSLLSETEAAETEAADAFDKLSQENRLSRAAKVSDMQAKESEVKSLKVALSHSTEDYNSVSEELKTVNGYLDKLKPQCVSSVPSYAERKAAREAEIAGLKQGLSILDGQGIALEQTGARLLRAASQRKA